MEVNVKRKKNSCDKCILLILNWKTHFFIHSFTYTMYLMEWPGDIHYTLPLRRIPCLLSTSLWVSIMFCVMSDRSSKKTTSEESVNLCWLHTQLFKKSFFSFEYRTFVKIDQMLGHKYNLNKFQSLKSFRECSLTTVEFS